MHLRAGFFGLSALSLAMAVAACNDKVDAIIPTPDASLPEIDSGAPDAQPSDAADGGDGALCNGTNPGYAPPALNATNLRVCTNDQIDAYMALCAQNQKPQDCQDWFNTPANVECTKCIYRRDENGPLYIYTNGKSAATNTGACVAVKGDVECGNAMSAAFLCAMTACENCPSGQKHGACDELIVSGDCKKYYDISDQCSRALTAPESDCVRKSNTDGLQVLNVAVHALCGIDDQVHLDAGSDGGDAGSDAGDAETDAGDATGD